MLVIFLMLVTVEQNRVAQVTGTMEHEPAMLLLGRTGSGHIPWALHEGMQGFQL